MEPQSALPTEERVREALCSVDDPEVGMNIIDLGLVYRIDITPELVRVELTMTTPACPMGDLITAVSYTHLRAHETVLDLVCRLLLEKKKNTQQTTT